MNKLTMGSLFDGIGGFPRSGDIVGIDTIWSSEIDPCCEAVTKHHFPNIAQLGDITKINGAKVPPVDIICGGSPCQDLSVAGKRAGLAGERSGLYMEQIRIIREMRKASNNTYPRYMVWENVPGALSSNKGEDFRAVLEEAARCADPEISIPEPEIKNGKLVWRNSGCIVGNGWSIAWRILDAQFWGVPQRRRRIFLVADFGGECAGEVLLKQESLLWNSTKGREAREGSSSDVERSIDGSVPNGVKCLNQHDTQSQRVYDANGIYPALSANENGGQNRQAICLQANGIDRKEENGCNGRGWSDDVAYTLNTIDRHAVAYDCRNHCVNDVSATIQAKENGGQSLNYINPIVMATGQANSEIVRNKSTTLNCVSEKPILFSEINSIHRKYIIRRLTPLECERLQGYPDGWTDVSTYKVSLKANRKNPAKTKVVQMSDSARYRMCGNSVAIPCVVRVLGGIAAQTQDIVPD